MELTAGSGGEIVSDDKPSKREGQMLDANTAGKFIKDMEAGLRDEELMEKHGFQGDTFYRYKAAAMDFLAKEKSSSEKTKRSIKARQFLHDVSDDMEDQALMEKYRVTQRQLQSLFRQLIHAGLMTPLELANRLKVTKSQVTEAFVEMGKAVKELD
jgi:hypothetical protein